MINRFSIFLFLSILSSCYKSELIFEDQYEAVVEAYLYVDKVDNQVKLTNMISFGSDTVGGEMITGAQITMHHKPDSWILTHNDSIPGTYYLEEELTMTAGDTFSLSVELDEEVLTAITIIPDNPPPVSMSAYRINIPKVESMMGFREIEMPDPLELTWDNPEAKYYFLNIQNIESYPISVMPDPPADRPFAGGGFAFQMITQPTNDNFYTIDLRQLTHYGTHRIIFTSVNDEYVSLYNSLNQDTRELNEPYSNIENGLGIFTAFNSDTLYFEVVPVYQ